MTSERFFSPNEAAKRLGVSVRALRLYERKGLVTPRQTAAGWRVYGAAEIASLHQILALKTLGLPLARIGELMSGRPVDLDTMLALQEAALERRRTEAERAIASIRAARAKLANQQALSLDEITQLARETAMSVQYSDEAWDALFDPYFRRRLSPAQLHRLMAGKADALQRVGLTEDSYDDAWRSVIADATRLMERGDDSSAEAVEVLRRWMSLADVFTKGDPDLRSGSMLAIYDGLSDPNVAAQSPISEELLAFMSVIGLKAGLRDQAFTDAPVREGRDHSASEAAVRKAIKSLARGEPTELGPYDASAGTGLPPALGKRLFAALGPLKSIRFVRTDAEGDVHRVTFANGALKCTTRQGPAGTLAYLTIVTHET